jgi:hypothetical protein
MRRASRPSAAGNDGVPQASKSQLAIEGARPAGRRLIFPRFYSDVEEPRSGVSVSVVTSICPVERGISRSRKKK